MLQACLNGARMRDYHPAVPLTVAEIARDAALVVAAGARELHIHPRGPDGLETLEPHHIAQALAAVRAAVPSIPIGLSTQWNIAPGGIARRESIQRWKAIPDYVSINLIEEDADELISLVLDKGIGVEAGIWSVKDAERFVTLSNAPRCLRVLIEVLEQNEEDALGVANDIQTILTKADIRLPILLHGEEANVWPMYREAVAKGFAGRIGLEDGNRLPSGKTAWDNEDLIRAAIALV